MNDIILYSTVAFFAGIILNLTPCVLPVIPFKIQAVLREVKSNLSSRILAAIAFMAGSIGFFLLLGFASIYLGLLWGELFQSLIFRGVLSLFLFVAAIATFSDWSMRLPEFLYRIPAHKYIGAILTGALAGILSTPCSGPFLGAVLAYSVTLPPQGAIVLFLFLGIGLAFPYTLLLIWPSLLNRLQFSGAWTLQIKHVLGFVLIWGALFFSQGLIPEILHTTGWILLTAIITIWALVLIIKSSTFSQRILPITALFLITILVVVIFNNVNSSHSAINWQPFNKSLIKQAREAKRPVMIEFTADWCINCKVLEKTVFKNKKVIAAVQQADILSLRVDLTEVNKENKALIVKYGGFALPYVVLLDRKGSTSEWFTGIIKPKTLVDAIIATGEPL